MMMPSTPPQRPRRTKQVSSAGGSNMFGHEQDNDVTKGPALLPPMSPTIPKTTNDSISLKDMALRLRRAKRSLLLSAVSMDRPVSPSESLRTIMTHLSSSSSSEFMTPIDDDNENHRMTMMDGTMIHQHMIGSSITPLTNFFNT